MIQFVQGLSSPAGMHARLFGRLAAALLPAGGAASLGADSTLRAPVLGAVFALCCWPAAAAAQSSLTLRADPVPLVEVEINGLHVRLEVDTQMSAPAIMMNSATAQRLRIRPDLFGRFRVGVDGSDSVLNGRVSRQLVRFSDGREIRTNVGIFAVPVSTRADGVIGAEALPYDSVSIVLRPSYAGERAIVLPVTASDSWRARTQINGQDYVLGFHLERGSTVFSRGAANLLDEAGILQARGELVQVRAVLGLTTAMQPVQTGLRIEGLALGATFARVNAPLLGAIEEDAIVVTAPAHAPNRPAVFLGREALSVCSSITTSRSDGTLTLLCARGST